MKYVIIASVLALGLGMPPALAESKDTGRASDAAHEAETIHAPTNRVGAMVPTMTPPGKNDDAERNSASGGQKAEKLHAPTNRVGAMVPTMTAPADTSAQ